MKLDQIDRKIIHFMQENARITNAELADKVGLSPTPCLRRLRRLESEKIIKGYNTEIDRKAVGMDVSVIALVKLERRDDASLREFEKAIDVCAEVIECHLITGRFDYFMHVTIPSLSSYEVFLSDILLRMPNVAGVESSFTLREVTRKAMLPVE